MQTSKIKVNRLLSHSVIIDSTLSTSHNYTDTHIYIYETVARVLTIWPREWFFFYLFCTQYAIHAIYNLHTNTPLLVKCVRRPIRPGIRRAKRFVIRPCRSNLSVRLVSPHFVCILWNSLGWAECRWARCLANRQYTVDSLCALCPCFGVGQAQLSMAGCRCAALVVRCRTWLTHCAIGCRTKRISSVDSFRHGMGCHRQDHRTSQSKGEKEAIVLSGVM